MKSTSLWAVLDEVVALTRVFVLKLNSLGTVAIRTIFFGGGSKTVNIVLKVKFKPQMSDLFKCDNTACSQRTHTRTHAYLLPARAAL